MTERTNSASMRVLAIGNSFSQNAATYLHDIAAASGTDLFITNLYIGGCSLETHWDNAEHDAPNYERQENGVFTGQMVSIRQTLESGDWDVITMQQASHFSGMRETYYPCLPRLAAFVRNLCPASRLMIHETWAYETGFDGLSRYHDSQSEMYSLLKEAYEEAARKAVSGQILSLIPSGDAFQLARENPLYQTRFDDGREVKLNCDGYHATVYGKYLLGAVWFEALIGHPMADNPFVPEGADPNRIPFLKECAHRAVAARR